MNAAAAYLALAALVLTSILLGVNVAIGNNPWSLVFSLLTGWNLMSVITALREGIV